MSTLRQREGTAAAQAHPLSGAVKSPGVTITRAALIIAAVGLAVMVGKEGTWFWRGMRVALVAGLAAVGYRVLRRGGRSEAVTAFGAGALAMPAGLGYAIQYLDKTGFSLGSGAGVAALAGGLTLVVVGASRLVSRARRWIRVPLGLGLFAIVFVMAWIVAQAVAVTNVPRTDLASTTPAERGMTYREVTFPTPDGVVLSGWYLPSRNGAAVALLHGSGSTRSDVLDHAVVLADHGYGVLLFDARGHGLSGGRAMDLGWYGDEDVIGAVSFLVDQPDVDAERIAAVGMSMGGEEAIGAAAGDSRLAAVVAEGATGRVTGDKGWLTAQYGWRGAVTQRIDWLMYNIIDLLTSATQPISLRDATTAAAPRPILLIAAGSVPTEVHAGTYIQEGSPTSVEVWVVPEAVHTGGLHAERSAWEARVTGFLDAALLGGGDGSPATSEEPVEGKAFPLEEDS